MARAVVANTARPGASWGTIAVAVRSPLERELALLITVDLPPPGGLHRPQRGRAELVEPTSARASEVV